MSIGLSGKAISKKMRGKSVFTLAQKISVKDFLKVEISLEELFRNTDGSKTELTPATNPYIYLLLEAELIKQKISFSKLNKALGFYDGATSSKIRGKAPFSPA